MATIDAMQSTDAHRQGPETQRVIETFDQYVVPNYRRFNVCLVRGEGSRVWDADGQSYLDLFPGWGCNLLGHCPAPVVEAVQKQMEKLIHVPNTWYMEPQGTWAKLLSERSFGGQAFFCNSGTEANEAAIKLVRLRSEGKRYKIITFQGGFHGRTMGSVSATAQPKYHEGLGPMVAGFQFAPHGDLDAVERSIDEQTGGILIESALTGRPTLGIDFDPVMVEGCQENIDWAKVEVEVKRGDATRFELPDNVAAVVVDPPYGRNSPGDEKLIEDMLANVHSQNSECGLVVILPVEAGGEDLDEEIKTDIELPGYEIKTAFGIPVHKSLGRVMIIASASTQD